MNNLFIDLDKYGNLIGIEVLNYKKKSVKKSKNNL